MSASYNDKIEPGETVIYPEIEALQYLIGEQKKMIEQQNETIETLRKFIHRLKPNGFTNEDLKYDVCGEIPQGESGK